MVQVTTVALTMVATTTVPLTMVLVTMVPPRTLRLTTRTPTPRETDSPGWRTIPTSS